jgi:hypothetical protein
LDPPPLLEGPAFVVEATHPFGALALVFAQGSRRFGGLATLLRNLPLLSGSADDIGAFWIGHYQRACARFIVHSANVSTPVRHLPGRNSAD